MNKRVIFILFLMLLMAITAFNVYAQRTASNDDLQADIQQLQEENQQVAEEKNELKQTLDQQEPAEIQAYHNALVKQVSEFVETAFVQNKGTYQERKEKAKKIMSEDLLETFFPTDTYKGETKASVGNIELFIKTGHLSSNHATVLVRLDHTLHSLQNDQKQVSPVFIEVKAQRQEDHWMMTEFTEAMKERDP
ncbi:hypothetical protein [Halobacillus seohaensis]|uniref:MerR family transcriptional regulator n=1 Tax=Halobacillus seohaensis TaxID=447421 RepID=A0ABW2ENB9_9BACI